MLEIIASAWAGYVLGCFCAGYYLVRWCGGKDVRDGGSGSLGASNVARILGREGYWTTGLLDALKGAAAVSLGAAMGGSAAAAVALSGVIAGHLWPANLGFRGGKGFAPAVGGLLLLAPWALMAAAAALGVAWALRLPRVPAGLLALAAVPVFAHGLGYGPVLSLALIPSMALVWLGHRTNLRDWYRSLGGHTRFLWRQS